MRAYDIASYSDTIAIPSFAVLLVYLFMQPPTVFRNLVIAGTCIAIVIDTALVIMYWNSILQ